MSDPSPFAPSPFAQPQGPVFTPSPRAPEVELPLAGWGRRIAASVIDWVIGLVVFFALLVLALAVSPDHEEISGAASIVVLVLACLAWPLQEPLLTARRGRRNGQSLGKQFLGIRIVRTSGERLSLGRALLRGVIGQGWLPLVLLSGIYTLVDSIVGFASNKRTAVHDLMSGTLVLRADVDPASLAAVLPPAPAQPQWSPAGPQWAPPPVPPQDRSWARRHLGWLIAGGVALALAVLAGGVTLLVTQVDFDQFNAEIEADNLVDELRDEPGIFSVSEVDPPDAGWDVQYDVNRGEATLYFDSDGLEVTWDYEIDDSAADSERLEESIEDAARATNFEVQ